MNGVGKVLICEAMRAWIVVGLVLISTPVVHAQSRPPSVEDLSALDGILSREVGGGMPSVGSQFFSGAEADQFTGAMNPFGRTTPRDIGGGGWFGAGQGGGGPFAGLLGGLGLGGAVGGGGNMLQNFAFLGMLLALFKGSNTQQSAGNAVQNLRNAESQTAPAGNSSNSGGATSGSSGSGASQQNGGSATGSGASTGTTNGGSSPGAGGSSGNTGTSGQTGGSGGTTGSWGAVGSGSATGSSSSPGTTNGGSAENKPQDPPPAVQPSGGSTAPSTTTSSSGGGTLPTGSFFSRGFANSGF